MSFLHIIKKRKREKMEKQQEENYKQDDFFEMVVYGLKVLFDN